MIIRLVAGIQNNEVSLTFYVSLEIQRGTSPSTRRVLADQRSPHINIILHIPGAIITFTKPIYLPTCTSLECGRKLKISEKTHAGHGENVQAPYRQHP